MRQRIWRSILALGIGAMVSATAAAQTPAPAAPAAPATAAPVVVSTSGGGCSSCGDSKAKHHGSGLFRIGAGCASTAGCSSCKQERTFLWGGCHQFFNAGNDCGGHFGHGGGKVYGPRAISPPCTYFSYHHR